VLHRLLRGCGAVQPAFLDLGTAPEAALLEDAGTDQAHRFRLYGALFVADDREPTVAAKELGDRPIRRAGFGVLRRMAVRAKREGPSTMARTLSA
jgi:hypothetical protein